MLILSGVLVVLLLCSPAWADYRARTEQELDDLRQKIALLTDRMAADARKENKLATQLEIVEKELSALELEQARVTVELEDLKARKMQTGRALYEAGEALDSSEQQLARLVRHSFIASRLDGLSLVLNQDDPHDMRRNLALFRYLALSRQVEISQIREIRSEHVNMERALAQQEQETARLLARLGTNVEDLARSGQQRTMQLAKFREDRESAARAASDLKRRSAELEKLLAELNRRDRALSGTTFGSETIQPKKVDKPPQAAAVTDGSASINRGIIAGAFVDNRGRLALPVPGTVRHRYGETRRESGLVWEGLMLSARRGEAVSAIFSGQVVFSDWFGSYGQLLVLDHGDGFMSLYGHNQSLMVDIGDNVAAGQQIASVGDTGGLERAGLYFEIREHGVPTNPAVWCRL